MINIFRLFVWQPWIRLLPKTITINDKVIDEKYSKSTFLKKNVSVTSSFFPWLTNGLKHLSFKIKKNTNRTEPFFVPILMQTTAFTWSFLERPGVIEGMNELVSDDIWSYMQWSLKGKCFNFLCSIGLVGICECFSLKSLDVDRDVSTAYCKSSSGDGVDWFRHSIMYHGGLLRLVHFDPAIVSVYHGFLRRSLICRASLALMFSNCRHLRFRYFGSVVPVYVVWVKSYVNCLFRFPCVPMFVSVYKLYFVSQRLVSGSVSMFWNRGILSACESYIPVVFFHAFLHGSSRFSGVDFTAWA